jgi:hypothetical protein
MSAVQTAKQTSAFTMAMKDGTAKTWNNAKSYGSPDYTGKSDGRLSLFFKSVRGLNMPQMIEYLGKAASEDIVDAFVLAFHIRDCRGGKGERQIGRWALRWLLINYPDRFLKIGHIIPEYGRWDDLVDLFPSVFSLKDSWVVSKEYMSTTNNISRVREVQQTILSFYAQQLLRDKENMEKGEVCSLAAKWAPTEGSSLDRKHGVVKELALALRRSPRLYRITVLSPLRAYLGIVESYMCSGDWDHIKYSAVPSCAMNRLKKAFGKNDTQRFNEWKELLKKGKVKVNAKQLFPHELVKQYMQNRSELDTVTEEQWNVLEIETSKLGVFEDSIVLSDVSGSMESQFNKGSARPIDVSVALGILISSCTRGRFKNHIITFETDPKFKVLRGNSSLYDKVQDVKRMGWGGSTNIQAVFNLILHQAQKFSLGNEDMPKRLFILSDFQFDQACEGNHKTNWEVIKKKYELSGYELPQIVFWNLNGKSTDFPTTNAEKNVIMISGFTTAIMKQILKLGTFTPYDAMRITLDDERYSQIRELLS